MIDCRKIEISIYFNSYADVERLVDGFGDRAGCSATEMLVDDLNVLSVDRLQLRLALDLEALLGNANVFFEEAQAVRTDL